MRDGELAPGMTMNLSQKKAITEVLDAARVDVIEVGYPGVNEKDFDEIVAVSSIVKQAIICGLAGSNAREIEILGQALKNTSRSRINIYTNVNHQYRAKFKQQKLLDLIDRTITLARNYTDDVQWSAFDAVRSNHNFLYQAIEKAINCGANTICIPDSFGSENPEQFADLIGKIGDRVSNIDRAIISVHCHDDRGLAVDNSLAAIGSGARQVECSINGIGARKGNANLVEVIKKIKSMKEHKIDVRGCLRSLICYI